MLKPTTKFLSIAALSLAFVTVAGTASADTQWQKNHPRREQVNSRLANQNKRIKNEVKEGDITKFQAASLRRKDNQIRQEERDMARQNGGHITKQEQKTLNQQENAVSKQIGK
jgi:CRISPR/Cas system-associated endoribonuclease Cas2